ncbi:cob(I)yrinic acid a,c-diamide adenosyltransferase [Prevotella sp. E13-17]|uniref:cob(I)yrinic acid a,c-diamide adenosyltransferase n=1 Tax=Prevotella sp. E13-17 TaxID=2913616 RepID=UPI001EDA8ECA|nr:cob(I)yrinic acid a,c-diamide adenosyltransferase [Prevotella sp. E13-17]UKK51295.1 cob(I)yrinic acid a,c-diamide adenosyltransferase [Prevotella sp. E13-17]
MTKIYTRRGDGGLTDLIGGIRIRKNDVRLEAYGTVDELSSHLGLLAAWMGDDDEHATVLRIQNDLFYIGSHLATDQTTTRLYASAILPDGETQMLEQHIDEMQQQLPEVRGFILPGGCQAAAQAHVCRTVCRRAERHVLTLAEIAPVDDHVIQFLNRLSDYLFVLAKKINIKAGRSEIMWQNACR